MSAQGEVNIDNKAKSGFLTAIVYFVRINFNLNMRHKKGFPKLYDR